MAKIDFETAQEFHKTISMALDRLFAVSDELRAELSTDKFRIFATALVDASCELDLGVLETIYREHPQLRPAYMPSVMTLAELEGDG